jgi:hypothetical protein
VSAPAVIEHVKASLIVLKCRAPWKSSTSPCAASSAVKSAPSRPSDALLTEELIIRENRRVKMAVQMAKLWAIKTLTGFDFAFQAPENE